MKSAPMKFTSRRMTKIFRPVLLASIIGLFFAGHSSGQSDNLYPIRSNGKTGFADNTGKVVIAAQFDFVSSDSEFGYFVEGFGSVQIGDKWGYVDRTGAMVIKPQFDAVSSFREGLALVTVAGNRSFIDKSGKVLFSVSKDASTWFSDC